MNFKTARVTELAGLLNEKKLSAVKAKWSPPEGFFSGSAASIVNGLLAAPGGHAKAMSRLNFYINRAGKSLKDEDKTRLDAAKEKLSKKLSAMKEYYEVAGLPALVESEDPNMELDEAKKAADDADAEAPKKDDAPADEEEETLPKIVLKIAKKAVGKDEEALADLLMKVYDAAFKDGVDSTKEDEEKEDKSEKEEK